ncbi:alpha-amylase family protein [Myceligenerans cantabricum]
MVEVLLPYDPGEEPEHLPLRLVGADHPGSWGADVDLPHGTEYGFSVDGGPLLPDPRSVWLPDGIHGPSRVFDPTAYAWSDGAWSPPDLTTGVLLHVDVASFTPGGTFDDAAHHLVQIADLGIDGIEIAPVAAFDTGEGPSGGVRLHSVAQALGGPAGLQRLVDAAHRAGLAVVLNVPYRWAVTDGLGLDAFGPYSAGYQPSRPRTRVDDQLAATRAAQAMRPRTGQIPLTRPRTGPINLSAALGSARPRRPGQMPARLTSGPAMRTDATLTRINLDGSGSLGPRGFLIDNAQHWFHTFHLDGIVLDAPALADRAQIPFVQELADSVVHEGERTGRRYALYLDGPGLSDRLTSSVAGLLLQPGRPEHMATVRMLAETLAPSVRRAARQGPRHNRRNVRRAGAAVVEDITRLPGAMLAVPWADEESPARALLDIDDVDVRASLLAFAALAGTPLVLDTEHVPVVPRTPDEIRLTRWARTLLRVRRTIAAELELPLDIRASTDSTVFAAVRGRGALVLNTSGALAALRLSTLLRPHEGAISAPAPEEFRLQAAWEPGATRLVGDTLTVPPRMVAVLRAD